MPHLRKFKVTPGIFWLEAPEAGVTLLCGCPADSVKHLIKRGLIASTELNSVTFETGPNAILLSDVLVQNGSFSNLAEFPVLQMLYRQGMILPGHPNNTGLRPLLIGSREQVSAQMRYIYRGNYGLVSLEEIMACGVDASTAQWMMQMKLAFAFGKIRTTEELLDSLIVEETRVEIRNGLTVRRLRLNVFEFQYAGESTTIDLNLSPEENYVAPYSLDFHHVRREYFGVIHSGEGDGWDIDRPCMASLIMFQGRIFLIDAGPNILATLTALGIGINEVDGLFQTHSHDDHFAGITTLIRSGHRIRYYATPLVRASVSKKLAALLSQDESAFQDYFEVHDLEMGAWNDFEGLEVKPIFSPHPVETTVFHFRTLWEEGYRTYAHMADIASLNVLERMVREDPATPGISEELASRVKHQYLTQVDLKKIDIGGGLIHGRAEDFRSDKTPKIILSHTSQPLSAREKEIGSSAPFGTADVLVPDHSDFLRRSAFEFLRSYFPAAIRHHLRILMNNRLVHFNPGSIVIKEGEKSNEIFLMLNGSVEQIQSGAVAPNLLSAGALLGEVSGLYDQPSPVTYRSASHVVALRLPRSLYLNFVKRNRLYANIEKLHDQRLFLQGTWLFGESIAYPVQNRLAQSMVSLSLEANQPIGSEPRSPAIFLVRKGTVVSRAGGDIIEAMAPGDFFGEQGALFGAPGLFEFRTETTADLFQVPVEALRDIPVVRWKLFEAHRKRIGLISRVQSQGERGFRWQDSYLLGIPPIDHQHQHIFEIANGILALYRAGSDKSALLPELKDLAEYARYHFAEEEALMARHGYLDLEHHKEEHRKLMTEIGLYRMELESGSGLIDPNLERFLTDWIVNHILETDKRYQPLLSQDIPPTKA
ncbi:MAG: bacteriohemerythrin [Magnetococcales bacterium]|nr:bacteriohemerythrin [Magnetococcales bacterium]